MQRFNHPFTVMVFVLLLVLTLPLSLAAQEDMQSSTSPVQLMADFSEVEGAWSTLTRYDNGVSMTVHTSGLTPGHVVTVWWAVINNPAMCSDGVCGEDDIHLFDEEGELVIGENGPELNLPQIQAIQASLLGATGNVIPDSGAGHFSAWLGMGDAPAIIMGPGLLDPMGAEIWLILLDHGPLDPELLDTQIREFNGGCDPQWPNEPCVELQIAMHRPPSP